MKKKRKNDNSVAGMMAKIQEQLAVLDQKLDSFMTKSLTELAQALAASKAASHPHVPAPAAVTAQPHQPHHRPGRPMYAVVCFDCGNDCEIPFKPSPGRPVYCRECFAKRKSGQGPRMSIGHKPTAVNTAPSLSVQPAVTSPKGAPSTSKKKSVAKKKAPAKKSGVKKKAVKKKKAKRK